MTSEPSYLALLRSIATAECNAEIYLTAWAETTPRDDVGSVIKAVALREAEHSKAFQKRICELGFDVAIEETSVTADKTAIVTDTALTDREKFEKLGLGRRADPAEPDRWAGYFDDTTIDIGTGELLGRFIAEERDSVRMLADCYEALCAEDGPGSEPARVNGEDRLVRIERLLEQLVTSGGGGAPAMTEAAFRAELRHLGYDDEIRLASYEASSPANELHAHDFSARLYVLGGEFILHREDGGPQSLTAGQYCDVPAGVVHAEAAGPAGARVLAGLKHH